LTSRGGEPWSIQRLVQEELKQPIRGAACGGTHRLMGFSYAVNKRVKRGKPVVGRVPPGPDFRRQLPPLYLQLAERRRQLQHRMVHAPRRQSRDRPPVKNHGPYHRMAGLLAIRPGAAPPEDGQSGRLPAGILASDERHKWEVGPLVTPCTRWRFISRECSPLPTLPDGPMMILRFVRPWHRWPNKRGSAECLGSWSQEREAPAEPIPKRTLAAWRQRRALGGAVGRRVKKTGTGTWRQSSCRIVTSKPGASSHFSMAV